MRGSVVTVPVAGDISVGTGSLGAAGSPAPLSEIGLLRELKAVSPVPLGVIEFVPLVVASDPLALGAMGFVPLVVCWRIGVTASPAGDGET